MEIRLLKADEIECRVQVVKDNGFSLLLYKDARCDMKILDELFGVYGWQRKHELINGNLFCTVSIYDKTTGQWIDKQDVGTESYAEKEKGQASDSFKRACFNIGIGRELYTAPFIWIVSSNKNDSKYGRFKVKEIDYNKQREISHLIIVDDKGKERFRMGQPTSNNPPTAKSEEKAKVDEDKQAIVDGSLASDPQIKYINKLIKSKEYDIAALNNYLKTAFNKSDTKALTKQEASEVINMLNNIGK